MTLARFGQPSRLGKKADIADTDKVRSDHPPVLPEDYVLLLRMRIWEVVRATSAAPSYFKEFHLPASEMRHVDGAIHHNNPTRIRGHVREYNTDHRSQQWRSILPSTGEQQFACPWPNRYCNSIPSRKADLVRHLDRVHLTITGRLLQYPDHESTSTGHLTPLTREGDPERQHRRRSFNAVDPTKSQTDRLDTRFRLRPSPPKFYVRGKVG